MPTKIIALLLTLLALPALTGIALLIVVIDGRPVFFRQERIGLEGSRFRLYKFRTMVTRDDTKVDELHPKRPLTRTGSILRRTGLDELPQLVNALKGEMNLVGPRPLPLVYIDYLTREEHQRHRVRPGITGPVQIKMRAPVSTPGQQDEWSRKFQIDLWYVDHKSVPLDTKILFKTVGYVVSRLVARGGEGEEIEDLRKERAES